MKLCIFTVMYLAIHSASASEICSGEWAKNLDTAKAIGFMQSVSGYFEGDTCQLSIQMCTDYTKNSNGASSSQVGSVLLVNRQNGDEFYLPLDFQSQPTRKTKFEIENGRRMFHYELIDRNPDSDTESKIIYLFEAVKTDDLTKLEYIEFGIRRPTETKINWAVCKFKTTK